MSLSPCIVKRYWDHASIQECLPIVIMPTSLGRIDDSIGPSQNATCTADLISLGLARVPKSQHLPLHGGMYILGRPPSTHIYIYTLRPVYMGPFKKKTLYSKSRFLETAPFNPKAPAFSCKALVLWASSGSPKFNSFRWLSPRHEVSRTSCLTSGHHSDSPRPLL